MTDMDKTIIDAFEIAAKTHENISKLIKRCKKLCKESGYYVLTKDFIHWWTCNDNDDPILPSSASWSTRWFILPFSRDDEENVIYVMEVNLFFSRVMVAKFIYDTKIKHSEINNNRFDNFSLPISRDDDGYSYDDKKINEFKFTKATLQTKRNRGKFWANSILFAEFYLSEIKADNVKEKIFGTFDKLAELNS